MKHFFDTTGRFLFKQRSVVIVNLTLLTTLLVVIVASAATGLLVFKLGSLPDLELLKVQLCEKWRVNLRPEPVERAAYLVGVLFIYPTIIASAIFYNRRMFQRVSLLAVFISLSAIIFVVITSLKSRFFCMLIEGEYQGLLTKKIIFESVIATIASGVFMCLYILRGNAAVGIKRKNPVRDLIIYSCLGTVGIIWLALSRIRSPEMLFDDLHFEAVFYCVSQVVEGKTLLYDLPAQYGLYAELLFLLFRYTGVSVLGFSLVMAGLQAVVVILLIVIVLKTIRISIVRILCVLSLFLVVGSTWDSLHYSPVAHEYYQIWPLRILFPVITITVFLWGERNRMRWTHLFVLGVISGVGIIWNLESGVACYGALVSSFLVQSLFSKPAFRGRAWCKLVLIVIIPLICVSIFTAYLTVKAGALLSFIDVIKFQSTFYKLGFGMLPLPTVPHPWMVVFLVYIYGIAFSVVAQARSAADRISKVLLILSVIGIGLFTYYQGRSHDVVLSMVMWPAIIILFIILEKTLRSARLKLISRFSALPVIVVMVYGLMSSYSLVSASNYLFGVTKEVVRMAFVPPEKSSEIELRYLRMGGGLELISKRRLAYSHDIKFVQRKVENSKSVAILSPGQSILFAENGLVSAVPGPGLVETLLEVDRNKYYQFLLKNPIEHVFIQSDADGKLPSFSRILIPSYKIADSSPNNLLYLQPNRDD